MTSDKQEHGIWDLYHKHLDYTTKKKVDLLEVGVFNGDSVNYFAEMFTHKDSVIYGVDIRPPVLELNPKVKFILTGQDNPEILQNIDNKKMDIIVDDASHDPTLTLNTFNLLWDVVKEGGWYIVEDWHPAILPGMANVVTQITERIKDDCDEVILWQKDTNPVAAVALYKKKKGKK